MVGVFWAGLAVWLLFAIAPIRLVLGLVPRRRSTVTGGLSYQETLGGGQRQGLDDHYEPQVSVVLWCALLCSVMVWCGTVRYAVLCCGAPQCDIPPFNP